MFSLILVLILIIFIKVNFANKVPNYEILCGNYDIDFSVANISDNPNYVFTPDSTYEPVGLYDIEGNYVIVNSFIECKYYFETGWNFKPNTLFQNQINNLKNCRSYLNFRDFSNISKNVYINDNSPLDVLSIICSGKTEKINNQSEIFIQYNKFLYFLLGQLGLFLFVLLKNSINFKKIVYLLFAYAFFVQILFNYNFGLNLFNSVSIYSTLFVTFWIFEKQNEE